MRPRRRGHPELSREDLLALKAFALLRAHGLNSRIAADAVESAHPSIVTFVKDGKLPSSNTYKVGARLMSVRGRIIAAPINGPVPSGATEVGRVELDLRGIVELLPGQRRTGNESQAFISS